MVASGIDLQLYDPNAFKLLRGQFRRKLRKFVEPPLTRDKAIPFDAQQMRLAHMNYRDVVLHPDNLRNLVAGLQLIYFDPNDGQYGAALTPEDQQDLVRDFFVYTMMPNNSFAFNFAKVLVRDRKALINDWIAPSHKAGSSGGGLTSATTMGFPRLRAQILNSNDPKKIILTDVDPCKLFFKAIGLNLVDEKTEQAIYRWGIRASADELRNKGIFYFPASDMRDKDRVYLLDIGAKVKGAQNEMTDWANTPIKYVEANQIKTKDLYSYPTRQFQAKALGDQKRSGLNSQAELKKLLEAMGFEVPGVVETEAFVRDNPELFRGYLSDKWAELSSGPDQAKAHYVTQIAKKFAALALRDYFNCDIVGLYKPETKAGKHSSGSYLVFINDDGIGIASIEHQGKKLYPRQREQLQKQADALGAQSYVMVFKTAILEEDILKRRPRDGFAELELKTLKNYEQQNLDLNGATAYGR